MRVAFLLGLMMRKGESMDPGRQDM